jgi:hypothetical protein
MMRLRRAPVIVALCVLASAATAYAECGWVLWVTTANRSAHRQMRGTRTGRFAECKEALYGASMKKQVDDAQRRGTLLAPKCLPDTVDPRGPKGK